MPREPSFDTGIKGDRRLAPGVIQFAAMSAPDLQA